MAPDLASILRHAPELEEPAIAQHLSRVDDDYLRRFGTDEIGRHIRALSHLGGNQPAEILVERLGDRRAAFTVIAFDHEFEFSLIAGVLAAHGFHIQSGEVFTLLPPETQRRRLSPQELNRLRRSRRPGGGQRGEAAKQRRVIIDRITGGLDPAVVDEDEHLETIRTGLLETLTLLERGDKTSVETAKRRVNEWVTQRIAGDEDAGRTMPELDLDIEQVETRGAARTRLRVDGRDTPAFLYSISTVLSLHGLSIERVHIASEGDHVKDEIDVVDHDRQPVTDKTTLERIRLVILLTKQFTFHLYRAPDPYTALARFEQLAEWITLRPDRDQAEAWTDLIADPRTMADLAKLLGTSDFLWDEFVRTQYEQLLPIFGQHPEHRHFCPPLETMPLRMQQALEAANGFESRKTALNRFKDREIFLIDLDHILTPGSDFRELSLRLTLLAENLVIAAAGIVYEHLAERLGPPGGKRDATVPYAVFGLGKLGGVALGYASDIELLFMYGDDDDDDHGERSAFFEQHARETARFIRTKREGIFEVDMRLRPYGKDGPLACSLAQFRTYYGPDGQAHAMERLALGRLRWLGGDPQLGFEVEQLRDELLYDNPEFDTGSLWEVMEQQHEQKGSPGRHNAKYSPGALLDLETVVQLLQFRHARRAPQLRTPRLREAMESLRHAGVLDAGEYAALVGAYNDYRILINGLRMLRGTAQDLLLPPRDSDELTHLARRIRVAPQDGRSAAAALIAQFDGHAQAVQEFVERRFRPDPPGGGNHG